MLLIGAILYAVYQLYKFMFVCIASICVLVYRGLRALAEHASQRS